MALGLYVSVPFCRTKCTYCNFASDVFSKAVFQRYVQRVCRDIERASVTAEQMGGRLERVADSIYVGGGTPTVLDIGQLEQLFVIISQNFGVEPGAEVTVECAPGTLSASMIESFQRCGVNRVSLGVQSFVDQEAAAVGRLHNQRTVLDDIARLRDGGMSNINIDLIAGLPHQTTASWEFSLEQTIVTQVPHVSIYMLEVDEDSRLGRELIAGGTRYHAHFVPNDDLTADFYVTACERLQQAGVQQYEISNFARPGHESRHNLKYWTRLPYLGFGLDAHSMLKSTGAEAPRRQPLNAGPKAHASTERELSGGIMIGTANSLAGAIEKQASGDPEPAWAIKDAPGGAQATAITEDVLRDPEPAGIAPDAPGDHQPVGISVEGHHFSRAAKTRKKDVGFSPCEAVRFSTPDSLEQYVAGGPSKRTVVDEHAALEETFFLGLRLKKGIDLQQVAAQFGEDAVAPFSSAIADFLEAGLMEQRGSVISLTTRGRLVSNEVFERFVSTAAV